MSITFPSNLEPEFDTTSGDPVVDSINDTIVAGTAFKNRIQPFITSTLANITAEKGVISTLISVLDGFVITPPALWSGTSQDIQDVADALATLNTDLDLLTDEINNNFLPHTERLSGKSLDQNNLLKSNMIITYSIGKAAMAKAFKSGDKTNLIPSLFGSIFTGDTTLNTATTNVTRVKTDMEAIDIQNSIENNLLTSSSMVNSINAIVGVSSDVTALANHIINDDTAYNNAVNSLFAGLSGSSIKGYAGDSFDRFFFEKVVGDTALVDIINNINIT